MPNDVHLPVAVIGAGPVGLAAAAHLSSRRERFVVFEGASSVAGAVRQWGHVRLFSPWRYCVDAEARRLLEASGWSMPDEDELPTAAELVDAYLVPLASHPAIAPNLRLNARVVGVGRAGIDKTQSRDREARPFQLELAGGSRVLARAVIDASGTWLRPNPLGAGGYPAAGENDIGEAMAYGIPDVTGNARSLYAGKRTLVAGSGHSAIHSILNLIALKETDPETTVLWSLRRERVQTVYGGEAADALPARGALGSSARRAVESGAVQVLAPFQVHALERQDGAIKVRGHLNGAEHTVTVDRLIVATGFRPDLDLVRELRVAIDPTLESVAGLAPFIDPNLHSCGTVPPHGARELAQPEPGFFIVGAKSYGRAPTFLMATGHEQARSVVAYLAGDFEAAARVELVLPETGVCGPGRGETACCETAPAFIDLSEISESSGSAAASACCGGPAPAGIDACCLQDANARASGEDGCGCQTEAGSESQAAAGSPIA